MRIIALLLVAIVMLSQVGFLVLGMFLWTDEVSYRIFETTPEFARASTFKNLCNPESEAP